MLEHALACDTDHAYSPGGGFGGIASVAPCDSTAT